MPNLTLKFKTKSLGFYLDYLGGTPKPKVNDQTVKNSTILKDLDIIKIGSVCLQFSIKSSPEKAKNKDRPI